MSSKRVSKIQHHLNYSLSLLARSLARCDRSIAREQVQKYTQRYPCATTYTCSDRLGMPNCTMIYLCKPKLIDFSELQEGVSSP